MATLISIREYARRKGCSDTNIHKAIRSGKIDKGLIVDEFGKKKIDPELANAEWAVYYNPNFGDRNEKIHENFTKTKREPRPKAQKKSPPKTDEAPKTGTTSIAQAKLVDATYKAKMAKLNFEQKSGSLVEKSRVYKALYEVGQEMRIALQGIPDRVIDSILTAPNRAEAHNILYAAIADELAKISEMNKRIQNVQ